MIDKNHTYKEIRFYWHDRTGSGDCTLRDRTYAEALKVAEKFGYVEPKWYKPGSWGNYLIVVE